ncbi:MAG TPA: hypothetical protein DCF87_09920, partial [Opitutae bacterium]|nr:hypothetical protein [Opitutae bacterium]
MWRIFRVQRIHSSLFWVFIFFSLGIYGFQCNAILYTIAALGSLAWFFFPKFQIDILLSFACVVSGYLRMSDHTSRHPKCEQTMIQNWTCDCPEDLRSPCHCKPKHTTENWIVEIQNRNSCGRTDSFWGRLDPFESFRSFDFGKWKYTQNIAGELTPLQEPIYRPLPSLSKSAVHKWRTTIRKVIAKHFNEEAQSLLIAVFLGDKSALSQEIKHAFSHGGIAHILSVSGYHISLVGVVPLMLLKNRRKYIQRLGMALFPVIWIYVWICNAPVSAIRAATMSSFYVLGNRLQRPIAPFQCWTLAGLIVFSWNPNAAMSLGAQLSFAAVASIFLVLISLQEVFNRNFWWASLAIPCAAQLGTLAWTASTFGSISLVSLPMNV